jgi:hypothetical protein
MVALAKDTPLWKQIANDPNYKAQHKGKEDAIADEVWAHLYGDKGASILDAAGKSGNIAEVIEAAGTWAKVRQMIDEVFAWLADKLGLRGEVPERIRTMQMNKLAEQVAEELLSGKAIGQSVKGQSKVSSVKIPSVKTDGKGLKVPSGLAAMEQKVFANIENLSEADRKEVYAEFAAFEQTGQINPEGKLAKVLGAEGVRLFSVWHGSPHSFDKFSLSKIGTGEGQQAYGWGLYFTDLKSIANYYAATEHTEFSDLKYKGKSLYEHLLSIGVDDDYIGFQDLAFANKYKLEEDLQRIYKQGIEAFAENTKEREYFLKQFELMKGVIESNDITGFSSPSSIYKVKIHGDKAVNKLNFIRWDKGLRPAQYKQIFEQAKKEGIYAPFNEVSEYRNLNDLSGEAIYSILLEKLGDKGASEFLSRAGIDGIQYPTNYSNLNREDDGTYNYVVFDENAVEIAEATRLHVAYDAFAGVINAAEMADIKTQAQANGTFMKAPNGEDSNLNERQWLQTRTAAFKSWFGEWEADPANASKVVDANGEPLVVYHGTNSKFTVFDKNKTGKANGLLYLDGFYFTSKTNGYNYGDNKIVAFLNIRKPLPTHGNLHIFKTLSWEANDIMSKADNKTIERLVKEWYDLESKISILRSERFQLERQKQKSKEDNERIEMLTKKILPFTNGQSKISKEATQVFERYGYDGVSDAEGYENGDIDMVNAFSPSQIKSATDNVGSFDATQGDIRFSAQGNNI